MMIITQSAVIEACSKCPVEDNQGKCQKSDTHLHGGKAESAWCVDSRRHFPPGGYVLFTFCRNGNQVSKRRSSQETSCQPSSLVPYHRGPMSVWLALTYGEIGAQKGQVSYSTLGVMSELKARSLFSWHNRQSLKE